MLVVDDDSINLALLKAILNNEGHQIFLATDGQEAVAIFSQVQVDIVLMDVMMPVMDGYEATRQIKKIAGERFVPVIFLTALNDEKSLAKCVECGGDDFLTKPYNHTILRAKIDAMARVGQLHSTVKAQRDELAYHHERILREQEVVRTVFSNIVHSGSLNEPCIKFLISPMALFNGDLLLAARQPSGAMRIMLADFTGHGLSAAVGAMPTADIFYRMTAKGFSISDVISEINRKLRKILPSGLFCAACLIDIDNNEKKFSVWNGGVPDVLVRSSGGGVRQRYVSRHLPLGVVNNDRLDATVEIGEIANGDRIYLYTDGVIEAWNKQGEMFGQERLEAYLARGRNSSAMFDDIREGLIDFIGVQSQADDITLMEVVCDDVVVPDHSGAICVVPDDMEDGAESRPAAHPMAWRSSLEMDSDILKNFDPLPLLLHMVMEIQGLEDHREHLYMILAELYSNALDHGLLGLDSSLKFTPHGFSEYYMMREKALASLRQGRIKVGLKHILADGGGKLVIRLEDSGLGFDYRKQMLRLEENTTSSGRGITLVRSLCCHVEYYGMGNIVEAVYHWRV
ncbi:MAG: SpoIIE family protein phosphatase [Gammaproteobacteria bacterium]|nr:SpoIIE family protein phosphatase [Gammaproteobacteria bacterium]